MLPQAACGSLSHSPPPRLRNLCARGAPRRSPCARLFSWYIISPFRAISMFGAIGLLGPLAIAFLLAMVRLYERDFASRVQW